MDITSTSWNMNDVHNNCPLSPQASGHVPEPQIVCHYHTSVFNTCLLWFVKIPSEMKWKVSSSVLPSLLGESASSHPPPHHNPITCNIKKQTDKTRLLSRESRFLSSLMLNFSSIHVLPRFTLTHLMLPKCNLLFQASKPLHLLVFLPRREFLLFSYPENSFLYFIFFPTRTLNSTICHSQEQLVQPFCPSPVLSEHSVRAFFCVSLRIL